MPNVNKDSELLLQHIEDARDALSKAVMLIKGGKAPTRVNRSIAVSSDRQTKVDFTIPIRAFLKKYSAGLSGPEKFTLLLAYLAKGNENKSIALADIQSAWPTSLMGGKFNPAYTIRAKDNDWVHTESAGSYRLRPSWKAIFN